MLNTKPGDLLICINGKKTEYGVYIGPYNDSLSYPHVCYWPWGNLSIEVSKECDSELTEFREAFLKKHK